MTTRSQPRVWQICLQSIKSDVKNSETKFFLLFKLVHLCYVLYLLSWLYLLLMFQTFLLYFSVNTVPFSTVSSLINFSTPFCGCRVGVAVTTLFTHHYRLGSNPGDDAIRGLALLLRVLCLAPRGFSPGTPVSRSVKTSISKFEFDQESGRQKTTMWMYYILIVI